MIWLLFLLLLALSLAGLFLNILTLPGLWLMALAAGGYAWITHRQYLGWRTLIALLVLAIVGEVLEFFASTAGAKGAGASRRGLWGAIIGGFLGAIILSIPVPIVGTFVGILIGTFVGALVGELSGGQRIQNSLIVGAGAAKGRFLGTMAKLFVGVVMLALIVVTAFPVRGRVVTVSKTTVTTTAPRKFAPPPATLPVSASATAPD